MTYRLSARADADLAAVLAESVDRFGIAQALRYRDSLERAFEMLAGNPQMSRRREELASRARAYRHKAHMIVYREEGAGILIVRLAHSRSDWVNDPA